jgi:pimeloyl-ACP methyl ester carboxylesterase
MPLLEKTLQDIPYQEWQNGEITPETPVVLVLHWMGGDFTSLQFLFNEYRKPVRGVFLQAPYSGGDKFGGWSWFPDEEPFYDRPEAEQAPDIRAAADRVAGFLQALRALYPAKVAVTGMSQGGDISLALAAYTPTISKRCPKLILRLSMTRAIVPATPALCNRPRAEASYNGRTRMTGLSKNRRNRRSILSLSARNGSVRAIWLRCTLRLRYKPTTSPSRVSTWLRHSDCDTCLNRSRQF